MYTGQNHGTVLETYTNVPNEYCQSGSDSVFCTDLVNDSVFFIDQINAYFMSFILPAWFGIDVLVGV